MDRLSDAAARAGYHLPQVRQGPTSFLLYRIHRDIVHISGQIAQFQGERPYIGRLGAEVTLEDGIKAAELSALNILAWLAVAVEDDRACIDYCLELNGFVACTPEFTDQSHVISGASNLIVKVLGDEGRHTRTSIGVCALPFGVAVEINARFVLKS